MHEPAAAQVNIWAKIHIIKISLVKKYVVPEQGLVAKNRSIKIDWLGKFNIPNSGICSEGATQEECSRESRNSFFKANLDRSWEDDAGEIQQRRVSPSITNWLKYITIKVFYLLRSPMRLGLLGEVKDAPLVMCVADQLIVIDQKLTTRRKTSKLRSVIYASIKIK